MPNLTIIIASTREKRAGIAVATWFIERARQHEKFDVTVADLKEIKLPLLDEPNHPRLQRYEHDHTKAWSQTIGAADAFVLVVPEYNYGMPPALLNAIDYLFVEWHYKAAGFVSYGGISGGTRSVQMAKQVLTTVKIMPIPEAVTIPFFVRSIDAAGTFKSDDAQDKSATTMLDELWRWTTALRTLRT